MDSEIFEKLPPTKLFFRCAIPSMITMLFGALYQIADGIFVGRFVGEDALAAINLVMPVIMMVFAFSNLIATGSSVRISVLLGEKNREEASNVFSFSLLIIFITACILGNLGFIFAEEILRFLGPDATRQAVEYGITYIRIYAFFSPLLLPYFAMDNYLRVCGKERLSMWLNVLTQMLNVVLDVVLIVFLKQGLWAAAFTSCIGMSLGSLITLFHFRKRRMDLYYTKGKIKSKTIVKIFANGSSEFFSNISMSVMSVTYNFFLLQYGGTTAIAAFSVIMYVDSIMGMLVFGMCDAMQPAISYCYGIGNKEKIQALFKRVLIGSVVLSAASMLFMIFAGEFVAPLFIKPSDTTLLTVSITGMKIFSLSYLTGWVDTCFSSYFTAIEKPTLSLLVSFFGTIIFPVSALFLLTAKFALNGIWLSAFVSCTASAILTLILAKKVKTQKKIESPNQM